MPILSYIILFLIAICSYKFLHSYRVFVGTCIFLFPNICLDTWYIWYKHKFLLRDIKLQEYSILHIIIFGLTSACVSLLWRFFGVSISSGIVGITIAFLISSWFVYELIIKSTFLRENIKKDISWNKTTVSLVYLGLIFISVYFIGVYSQQGIDDGHNYSYGYVFSYDWIRTIGVTKAVSIEYPPWAPFFSGYKFHYYFLWYIYPAFVTLCNFDSYTYYQQILFISLVPSIFVFFLFLSLFITNFSRISFLLLVAFLVITHSRFLVIINWLLDSIYYFIHRENFPPFENFMLNLGYTVRSPFYYGEFSPFLAAFTAPQHLLGMGFVLAGCWMINNDRKFSIKYQFIVALLLGLTMCSSLMQGIYSCLGYGFYIVSEIFFGNKTRTEKTKRLLLGFIVAIITLFLCHVLYVFDIGYIFQQSHRMAEQAKAEGTDSSTFCLSRIIFTLLNFSVGILNTSGWVGVIIIFGVIFLLYENIKFQKVYVCYFISGIFCMCILNGFEYQRQLSMYLVVPTYFVAFSFLKKFEMAESIKFNKKSVIYASFFGSSIFTMLWYLSGNSLPKYYSEEGKKWSDIYIPILSSLVCLGFAYFSIKILKINKTLIVKLNQYYKFIFCGLLVLICFYSLYVAYFHNFRTGHAAYWPSNYVNAGKWLAKNFPDQEIILAPGLQDYPVHPICAYAYRPSYLYMIQGAVYNVGVSRSVAVGRFEKLNSLLNNPNSQDIDKFITQEKIGYIVFGPGEQIKFPLLTDILDTLKSIHLIYDREGVKIYKRL